MKRPYDTAEQLDNVTMFIGIEVEHTPAHNMKTLFVVGSHTPANEIILAAQMQGIEHVYFGANQSFKPTTVDDWFQWDDLVGTVLKAGFWATLDLDVRYAEELLESGLTESRRFIPLISVKLPYSNQLGYNATVKIDDKGFEASNPGVWCHRLHSLQNPDNFTSWDQYTKDTVLK